MIKYDKIKPTADKQSFNEMGEQRQVRQIDGDAIGQHIPSTKNVVAQDDDLNEESATKYVEKRFLTRLEFCDELRISETTYHSLALRGIVKPIKIGRRTLIPASEVDAVIERLNGGSAA